MSKSRRLPGWLKVRIPTDEGEVRRVAEVLRKRDLHTVCTSARCPNMGECWRCGTATFMILGNQCTRNCRFCAVDTCASPAPPSLEEPEQIASAVSELGLRYVVLTSVTRDDLEDGGAAHYAKTVHAIRRARPEAKVELLIPDLQGDTSAMELVLSAGADVVGHNLETVRRLTPLSRDHRASYDDSLEVLAWFYQQGSATKTALLLGLGEEESEIREALQDAWDVGVRHVAMGQYLQPSGGHVNVAHYWPPEAFDRFGEWARDIGYESVASAPLVRSSYRAEMYAGKSLR